MSTKYNKFFVLKNADGSLAGSYPSPSVWDGVDSSGKPLRPAGCVEVTEAQLAALLQSPQQKTVKPV